MVQTTCPDCGKEMEAGFIVDRQAEWVKPIEWVAGPPQRSWFKGTRIHDTLRTPLTALRCGECSLVKFYALEPNVAATVHSELAERVDRLETELSRLEEREKFLLELLQRKGALPAGDPPDSQDEGRS